MRISVVYMCGHHRRHTAVGEIEAFRSGQSCGVPENYVVFVGSRVSYKHFPLLVDALGSLSGLRLLVVGDAAILLEGSDQKYLSEAILHFPRSDVRRYLIVKGNQCAKFFSWDRTFAKTRDVYGIQLGRILQ